MMKLHDIHQSPVCDLQCGDDGERQEREDHERFLEWAAQMRFFNCSIILLFLI